MSDPTHIRIWHQPSKPANSRCKPASHWSLRIWDCRRRFLPVHDGGVLIGVDLHKSEQRLNAAYNDAAGVTDEFNLNILNSINKLVDANFSRQNFSHRAFYNQELMRIEMHLVSKESQTVKINGSAVKFSKGETLHTENSYKYSLESFTALCNAAGFELEQSWLDEEKLFSFHYLTVAKEI